MNFNFMTTIGAILSLSNLIINVKQNKKINSIEYKLSYIRDDISWIESNEIDQLLSNQAALRVKYEKDLADLFSNKQQSLELEKAIAALSSSASFSDPRIYDIMLASINNIDLLLNSTSETLMHMFDINEATLDKVLDLISEINSLKLKFNLDNADLQLKISDNSRLIIKLSEQQLSNQLSTLQRFEILRSDLELINSQVDKKLADFGVLSTNTTGIILSDGTFKLAETLNLVDTEVFDVTFSEVIHNSVTSKITNSLDSQKGVVEYRKPSVVPSVTANYDSYNPSAYQVHATTSCNKLNLLTSTLIKKFNKVDHLGIGLLFNRPYKLLISEINPQKDLFIFLRGAGLSSFGDNGLSVDFIPSLVRKKSILKVPYSNQGTYDYSISDAQMANVTWGQPGSYKIPSSTTHVKIGSIFTTNIIQKSDELIVIKVKLATNYSSVIAAGTLIGAEISGSGAPSARAAGVVNGGSFHMPSSGDILAGGSFIVNFPVNHLSFSGIECAQ